MKKKFKKFNSTLANPDSFWVGFVLFFLWMCVLVPTLLGIEIKNPGVSSPGNSSIYASIFGSVSLFFLAYGVIPDSKIGKIGKTVYAIYKHISERNK